MFWFWAFLSMFGHSIQAVFMVGFARTYDPMWVGFYRNLSFVFTFTPFLLLVDESAWSLAWAYWPYFLLSAGLAALSQWARFMAYRYLPVGVMGAVNLALNTVTGVFLAWFFLGDYLALSTVGVIALIVLNSAWLSLQKFQFEHLKQSSWKGGFFVVITSLSITAAFTLLAHIARSVDPILASVVWEILIAPVMLFLILFRCALGRSDWRAGLRQEYLVRVNFFKIMLFSAPTTIGTIGFAYASALGALGIVVAIASLGVIVTTVLSQFVHGECLKKQYYLSIIVSVCLVGLLKLSIG